MPDRDPAEQVEQTSQLEERLVRVARLGLIGDTRSLQQQLRNLQRGGSGALLSPQARARLAGMVADVSADAVLRTSARASSPSTRASGLPRAKAMCPGGHWKDTVEARHADWGKVCGDS